MVEFSATGNGLFRQGFAGDTFNAAWHARRELPADCAVSYFTAVGDDKSSERMLAFMQHEGIETGNIRRIVGKSPGLYTIDLENGERSFSYWRDTSAARGLADDAEALALAVHEADAIMFSGITLAILPPAGRENLLSTLATAKARGAIIAFDSNFRPRLWPEQATARDTMMSAARVATLALPTDSDEATLFGDSDAHDTARRYLSAGVAEVVVKAGPRPALLVWPSGEAWVGPEKTVAPVDTTGAGDSFNGCYVANRLLGKSPDFAAKRAHATAGRVVMAHGALV